MTVRPGVIRLISAAHLLALRVSAGRVGRQVGRSRLPVLVLATRGRRSGKRRSVPLVYLRDGHDLVLIGSFGGNDQHPAWFTNLRANPQAEVEVKGLRLEKHASTATAAERERLWPLIVALYPGYEDYQSRTRRHIPLVILRDRQPIVAT